MHPIGAFDIIQIMRNAPIGGIPHLSIVPRGTQATDAHSPGEWPASRLTHAPPSCYSRTHPGAREVGCCHARRAHEPDQLPHSRIRPLIRLLLWRAAHARRVNEPDRPSLPCPPLLSRCLTWRAALARTVPGLDTPQGIAHTPQGYATAARFVPEETSKDRA